MQTSPVFREGGGAVQDVSSLGFSSVLSGHSTFPSRSPQTEVWCSAPLSLQDPASRTKSSEKRSLAGQIAMALRGDAIVETTLIRHASLAESQLCL